MEQKGLCQSRQTIAAQSIAVIGTQQALLLERLYDVCFIEIPTGQTEELIGRKFAGYGNESEQMIARRLSAGERLR